MFCNNYILSKGLPFCIPFPKPLYTITTEEVYYLPAYRDNIVTISFLYQKDVPSNALISWDVSDAQDESIMAYLMPNGDKYDLYIISEDNIYTSFKTASMFRSFINVKKIKFNNLNTSNATRMDTMFYNCKNLLELDLSGFDTPLITNLFYMFVGLNKVESINLSSFDTSGVKNMQGMFQECHKLTILDLSNFNTKKVTNMQRMFLNTQQLKTIYIGTNWVTASSTDLMFSNCGTNTLTLK